MSDLDASPENSSETIAALKERTAHLEAEILQTRQSAEARLTRAELRAEAMRAGIVDLDGLKLLNTDAISIGPDGTPTDIKTHIAKFKQAKPWLFGGNSTTTTASAPASQPFKARSAMDMSDDEYNAARAFVTREVF